ncbi:alpha/beta hydrolase [Sinobacterium norvegicum]|uniref:alpha/beta hydrolase n=1 Tax=Sinobacterium norvegicum TaxID=1641715 RepID=UPI001F3EB4DD|nr:alpha/beta hydrolase [Sinobacterium norvegicum]
MKIFSQIKFLTLMVVGIIKGQSERRKHTFKSYQYATRDGLPLKLDLFLPNNSDNKATPLIIWFHGGGWQVGSRESIELAALKQLSRGFALASVSYSLSDAAQWPVQAHECKAAVRWLRANAKRFNINSEQFIAWGMSAGAHTACILGTSADDEFLNGSLGECNNQSNHIHAMIAFYPPTDFLNVGDFDGLIDYQDEDSPIGRLLGHQAVAGDPLTASTNPIAYVNQQSVPALLLHGDDDPVVPLLHSELMHQALLAHDIPSEFYHYRGYTHGDYRFSQGDALARVQHFLAKVTDDSTVSKAIPSADN